MEGIDGYVAFGGAVAVAAIVEVIKRLVKPGDELADRVLPALALVVGCAWNWLILSYQGAADQRIQTILLAGLMSGLMASGIWAQASATVRTFTAKPGASQPAPRG